MKAKLLKKIRKKVKLISYADGTYSIDCNWFQTRHGCYTANQCYFNDYTKAYNAYREKVIHIATELMKPIRIK